MGRTLDPSARARRIRCGRPTVPASDTEVSPSPTTASGRARSACRWWPWMAPTGGRSQPTDPIRCGRRTVPASCTGTGIRRVTGGWSTSPLRIGPAAVWSPDGIRIVYSSDDGMFVTTRGVAAAGALPMRAQRRGGGPTTPGSSTPRMVHCGWWKLMGRTVGTPAQVRCYGFEEAPAEELRALGEPPSCAPGSRSSQHFLHQ